MNNYHVYEEIGKGKYSNVYKGRKKKSIEYVAVKGLEKTRLKKLLNEVKMFSDLNHPNILKFYSWYESRNHLWVILEYCPGGDLLSLIKADSKGLSENTTKQFIRELCSGIMYLHSKGIIYCDLKPSNILFNEYGNIKISDLGLAKCLVDLITSSEQGPEDLIQQQKDMSKRGSPFYMAPELFQDGSVYSFQSDLWAIGCVAYELATGQPPFVSNSFTELVNLILNAEVQKIDNYSSQFNELIKGLLEKDPTKRWTWDRICKHPFFAGSLQVISIPPQPHFENWCKKNAHQQRLQERLVNSTPIQKESTKSPQQNASHVDILRLSLNVKKNMLREEAIPYEKPVAGNKKGIIQNKLQQQQQQEKINDASKDVKLIDRDQEIDIGSGEDQDEEKESDDASDTAQIQQANQQQNFVPSSPNMQKPQSNKENLQPGNYSRIEMPTSPMVAQSPQLVSGYTPLMKKPGNSNSTTQLVPLEQLFTHSSDTAVKPIIGNREIERAGSAHEQAVIKESLPFQYIQPDEINKNIDNEYIEQHFEKIYNALSSSNISQNDKLNIVNYFEQIVQSSNSANRLLNSAFTPLLLKLLRLGKSSQFKLRICCAIGLLIRHATVIDTEVSSMGIVETMIEILNSKEIALVRRKACAALGEYLFYGATQMDEDQNNTCWEMTTQSFNALMKILKQQNEDEIKNISSQSFSTGYKFAITEVVTWLIQIFLSAKNDNLKSSCAIAIANIVLLDNKLVDTVLRDLGLKNMVQIFQEATPRIQQAMITIFNLFLIQSLNNSNDSSPSLQTTPKSQSSNNSQIHQVAINTINRLLMEESNLLSSLIHLLDHATPVSKGKAALSIMFIIKFNINTLVALSEESLHFYTVLDKGFREQNEYFKQCLSHLSSQLIECVPWMINSVSDEIISLTSEITTQNNDDNFKETSSRRKQGKGGVINDQNSGKLKGNLAYLQVLLQFASTPCLQSAIFNQQQLQSLAQLLSLSTPKQQQNNSGMVSQAQHYLFNIVSQIATNSKILIKQQESIINYLLVTCIEQLGLINITESRFLFLNLIIELLNALLSEESIYDYPGFLKQHSNDINKLVINQLLVQIKQLLGDQPPLPFYALKLCGILLEHNPQFLVHMKKNKIVNLVLDMYRVEGNSITGHTLTVVQKIIDGSPLDELYQLGVLEKTASIFQQYVQSQQEWSYDDLSSILSSITLKIITDSRGKQNQAVNPENTIQPIPFPFEYTTNFSIIKQNTDSLINTIQSALQLFTIGSQSTQTNIALFLLHSIYIFSGKFNTFRQAILMTTIPIAKSAMIPLLPNHNTPLSVTNNNIHNYTLFKRCIKLIHWLLILNEQKPIKSDKKDLLIQILDRIKQATDDKIFINAAKEIPRYLL